MFPDFRVEFENQRLDDGAAVFDLGAGMVEMVLGYEIELLPIPLDHCVSR